MCSNSLGVLKESRSKEWFKVSIGRVWKVIRGEEDHREGGEMKRRS